MKPAHIAVAPVSAAIASTNFGVRASSASAAFDSSVRRSFGPVWLHERNASAAASTAVTASAALAAGARVARLPSSGLRRSKVAPFSAATARPLISMDRSDMCVSGEVEGNVEGVGRVLDADGAAAGAARAPR